MNYMDFIDKYNACVGTLVVVLSMLFGQFWYLFAGFLFLNLIDWLSGWAKARKNKQESSAIGAKGALKKLGYWVIIAVAFMIASIMSSLGQDILGIDLGFLVLFGWFTLANLMVNEARSILENFVEMDYNVPAFLTKGLAVTDKLINSKVDVFEDEGVGK